MDIKSDDEKCNLIPESSNNCKWEASVKVVRKKNKVRKSENKSLCIHDIIVKDMCASCGEDLK